MVGCFSTGTREHQNYPCTPRIRFSSTDYRLSGNFDNECRPCIITEDGSREKGLTLKCNCLNPQGIPQYTFIGMGPNCEPPASDDAVALLTHHNTVDHPLTVKAVAGRLICGDQIGNKSPNFAG